MTDCPSWKKPQPTAAYMGSARSGLGFYHIDLPKCETTSWLNISKCGVVEIRKGAISMQELEKELSEIFCREWSWQIREITPAKFLVRFPPHRKVSDIKSLPSFNLRKEGVQVGVVEWMGGLNHFSELKEVWIRLEGIPPKWCAWQVFAPMVSGLGLMLEVDWSSLFKSFYERVGIKLACRNPRKIPVERLYELDKKLYMINIIVEGLEPSNVRKSGDEGGNDDGGDDDFNEDECDDLEDSQEMETGKKDEKIPPANLHQWGAVDRWGRLPCLSLRERKIRVSDSEQGMR
jgi:hypothetical protein